MLLKERRQIKSKPWGEYQLYTLSNDNGIQVDISNLGATIVNLYVKDKVGDIKNIVLGYDSPQEYLDGDVFLGSVVGPWANRIAQGKFELNGEQIVVDQNEGRNHLHGGSCAIHKKKWVLEAVSATSVTLRTNIAYLEGGFPATWRFTSHIR